jgi:hypothetical protein
VTESRSSRASGWRVTYATGVADVTSYGTDNFNSRSIAKRDDAAGDLRVARRSGVSDAPKSSSLV